AENRGFAELLGVGAPAEDAIDRRQVLPTHRAVWIGVVEAVQIAAEEEIITVVDLMIQPQEAKPSAIVAYEYAGRDRRRHGRSLVLRADPSGREDGCPAGQRSPDRNRRLSQRIAGPLISAGGIRRRETAEFRRRLIRTP